jgi:dTDP-4-dehydrorhamnose 3,5-epimerase
LKTPISDLLILERNIFTDDRGLFYKLFCCNELQKIGLKKPLAQVNYSHSSKKYTTRGFHFQYPPNTETKITTCIRGEVFDVALDLRVDSPTFLQGFGVVLSGKNNLSVYIPDGFAHASQSLTEESSLLYMHSEVYVPGNEGGINVNDPMISVKWPHTPENLSQRDASFNFLNSDFKGITVP